MTQTPSGGYDKRVTKGKNPLKLTTQQQDTINKLEELLSDQLWETTYYGETPNQDIIKLFQQGVELNFEVTLTPYMGVDHPEYTE